MLRILSICIVFLLTLSGCLSPNRMFRTADDYSFAKDSMNEKIVYLIQPDDQIELHITSNDGFKLVDITGTTNPGPAESLYYTVEENGEARFPVIGRVMVAGLSIKSAEELLQEKYSKYYNSPFVLLRIINRNAIVFLGDGGKGTLVTLTNDNTSLYQVLAQAGGISDFSKSYNIKILRGDPKNPKIYLADISNVEALRNSELRIFSKDIIYVDSGGAWRKKIATDVIPLLSLITSILVIISYTNR
jgi:polysaccharide biosynthesis/export protein